MSYGPCMCGDTHCYSCGPAQGNHKCRNCGMWSADGGCEDPQACDAACLLVEMAMAAQDEEWTKEWQEYLRGEIGKTTSRGTTTNDTGTHHD